LIALGFWIHKVRAGVRRSGTAASELSQLIFASRLFSGVTARDTVSIWITWAAGAKRRAHHSKSRNQPEIAPNANRAVTEDSEGSK